MDGANVWLAVGLVPVCWRENPVIFGTDPKWQEERFPCETFQWHGGWTQAGLMKSLGVQG